jgi:hypothetical protein
MDQPEQKHEAVESSAVSNDIVLSNNDDARIVNDEVVGDDEKKERERRQEQEQKLIQKAIAFWNHPALRDVPFTEKRSYLHEQQGLTDAQIHKVWEEMVGAPRVGVDKNNNANTNNRPDSNSTGEYNITAPQQYSRHNNQHPQYNNHQSSSHLPTNTTNGQYFNSNEAPYTQSSSYNNHTMMNGRQHPYPPQPYDNTMAMEGGDGSISVVRGLSLLGVGGFVGVTGAAAVRWLNGGRFDLFPAPPTTAGYNTFSSTGTGTGTSTSSSKSASDKQQTQGKASYLQQKTHHHHHGQGNNGVGEHAGERTPWNIDRENNYEYNEEDDYNDAEYSDNDEDFDIEASLLERIDDLLSSIDSNSALQERLILKLANTSTITDDSMSLLKQNIDNRNNNSSSNNNNNNNNNKQSNTTDTPGSNSLRLERLKEVNDDLACLFGSIMNDLSSKGGRANRRNEEDWRKEWSQLSAKFENCMFAIKKPVDSFVLDSDAADNKSVSTSETTSTENQGGQDDVQSLSAAPSTPTADTSNKNEITSSATTTTSIPLSLKDCIVKVVEKNDAVSLKSGSQLLYLYLANLSGKPDNRRYRKIYTSNESFQKVGTLIGGKDLLHAVGFVEECDKGILEWVPTGSTEKEISALILVKEAAAALGVLKKPDNVPSAELVRSALSKLSSPSSSFPVPHQSPLPSRQLDENGNKNGNDDQDDAPQTPSGSALLSPPMPKKMPFIPTPSGVS